MATTKKKGADRLPGLVLRWSRQPNERGLARVCQVERGWVLKVAGEKVGRVAPSFVGFSRQRAGYYFYAGSERLQVPHINTSGAVVPSVPDAVSACEAHFAAALSGRFRVSFVRPASMPRAVE